jgi:hypothetical protein
MSTVVWSAVTALPRGAVMGNDLVRSTTCSAFSMFFALSCPIWAWAGVHVVSEGQTTSVPLDVEGGTVLQFPAAVGMVTATQHIQLERVGGTSSASATSKSKEPPAPVQHLRASVAAGVSPKAELVTVVLADGQALPLRLVPTSGADPFADLQWPTPPRDPVDPLFLGAERELMWSMLRDDPYRREVVNQAWAYAEYPDLDWTLLRRFRGDGVQGYTFVLRNTSREYQGLDITALAVDHPNRLALAQVEDGILSPCQDDPAHCWTVLRLVVRASGAPDGEVPSFSTAGVTGGEGASQMPFVRPVAGRGGR